MSRIPAAAISVGLACVVGAQGQMIGINVVLNMPATNAVVQNLGTYGLVLDVIPQINALTLRAHESQLATIRALPYVAAANPDSKGVRASVGGGSFDGFGDGANQWSLDAVNVTDFGAGRTVGYDGTGVYVAIIDDGFPFNWRAYLPEERIAVEHARTFGGGGGEVGTVSSQPNAWEHCSKDGHGIACASVILGFRYVGPLPLPEVFNGVAPAATVIPINVFNNKEFYWNSVKARSIVYVADLKATGALGDAPVVISMSNGGPQDDAIERAAIDYAIAQGCVLVAAAGNEAGAGMRFPARYAPVISAAASGNTDQWPPDDPTRILWVERDMPENDPLRHYMAPFTAVALPGQDLDVAAPGFLVPAPWPEQNGQLDYSFFGGTSAATPHIAGIAALMLQKNPTLTAPQIESILESTTMPIPPGCRDITWISFSPGVAPTWTSPSHYSFFNTSTCWGTDATGHGLAQADAALAATPLP